MLTLSKCKQLFRCKFLGQLKFFKLYDENKNEILPAYGYRDGRTIKAAEDAEKIVPIDFLYERCGIPKLNFNTVYQLYADKVSGRLDRAKYLLKNTSMSVQRIAEECGYASAAHFMRQFKEREKMSAGKYRKEKINE